MRPSKLRILLRKLSQDAPAFAEPFRDALEPVFGRLNLDKNQGQSVPTDPDKLDAIRRTVIEFARRIREDTQS